MPIATALSVNLNKIALMRNSRLSGIPSVTEAARVAIANGADGITVHPRPDLRHIRPSDVYELAAMLQVEFNIEGNPFEGAMGEYPGFLELVRKVRPAQCTLVPDAQDQLTSDHGWDLQQHGQQLKPIIDELKARGIRVSLFMDADSDDIELAAALGADRIELYTESYADAYGSEQQQAVFETFLNAAERAQAAGLGVNAGHDLNLDNLALMASIPNLEEVSIGHALVADALMMGLGDAVSAYKAILVKAGIESGAESNS
ncbi:pyridoxine 5'-phosphate synthase [Motiliproteus coralliicola]|uniref:Pyridoxine 5'-phosphate synthase n=1 Tax=Motiliproteus coralliicola TaxID=2283196 RepID=A0A369WLD1_9GAMM|nr:pyridoxine 5'-phosphate synthase [Motiliproteus coralliicola]RDE22512.1 pyridoxine 5'-phosphate synthase [Motiliproteus coralliicola]